MITEYLFSKEEETRLSEIVDELTSSEYIRRILDFNPEPKIDWGMNCKSFRKAFQIFLMIYDMRQRLSFGL